MLTKLQKAKNALNQLTVKGEENAVLYLIAHQNIDKAIELAVAKDAVQNMPEVNADGNDGN